MKLVYTFLSILFLTFNIARAQDDVEKYISDAKSAYGSGNLQDARFALEQTLQAIDVVIGKEILKILPTRLNKYDCDEKQDYVMGNSGGLTGLSVTRNYFDKSDSSKTLNISILNNSPMIATLNAFMTNPMFMNTSGGTQKVVRVAGYKSVLNKKMDEDIQTGYELQVPFGQSLMTFSCEGVTNESEMISMAEKVDIKAIAALAGGSN